ncbi:hypothetical protein [Leptospira interrogans]|uniref:Uncharacterized protein n=1 Tax=Leptospira interrogans serovar Bataviae TaxID=312175 RepID=A0AAQ0B3F7_LEPIR|nr:hypothetical protein [Leptospira interrogans]QOI51576.1 hypothetical protein Lepto1489_14755 [Leptospira interrogans serovar Bataviae]
MKRVFKLLIQCIFLLLVSLNCSYNWGQFKRYSVTVPTDLEVIGSGTRVTGSDCSFLPTRWYTNSIAEAVREALKLSPGATGLKDVEVKAQSYQYVFFGCIEVEGTPVREVVVPAKSTKKK